MSGSSFSTAWNSNASIVVDEIGIEIGVFGEYRLKTMYQPIFRRLDGMQIEPFAVEGSVAPFLHGRVLSPQEFAASLDSSRLQLVRQLSNALSCGNLRNLGADHLALFVETNLADLDVDRTWLALIQQSGFDPARFVCAISAASLLDRHELIEHTLTLRVAGLGVAIAGFGIGPWDIACMQAVRPDAVRIDPRWFKRVASNTSAAKLLVPLVAGLHDQGTDVSIEGIDTAMELKVALDCGADLLMGNLLGKPLLAGADIDLSRRTIGQVLGSDQTVIPLFA